MSRYDFMGLCRDRVILCRDTVGQVGKIFYVAKEHFCVVTRFSQGQDFHVGTEYLLSR